MKKQAQLIYNHFGEEKQRKKAKEERLELEIALNKLALYDLREEQGICQEVLRDELITDCNEEFADNVLMRMQLENLEFEESFEMMTISYSKTRVYHCYGIGNFYFSKEEVRKWVEKKIERTMRKYGIVVIFELKEGMEVKCLHLTRTVIIEKLEDKYFTIDGNVPIENIYIDWEKTKKLNGVE